MSLIWLCKCQSFFGQSLAKIVQKPLKIFGYNSNLISIARHYLLNLHLMGHAVNFRVSVFTIECRLFEMLSKFNFQPTE